MELKNFMECLVEEQLNEIFATQVNSGCSCERCRQDVAALALNLLPPRYVVSQQGELYIKANGLESQFTTDILIAISKAMAIVQAQPHHDSRKP